ncbi:MAG: prolipoprotein diacylglyceryl transferase [Anaerolineales bacterium]|nr:prolipoprotein diacylglyceryl transferase [Anaerolineales bacterium]
MLDGIQIDPVAFVIPLGEGFPVYWYGILIALGILLGAWWAGREIEKRGHSADDLYNGLLLVVIFGYLFARLGYVLQDELANPGQQYSSLLEVLNLRAGGANILWGFVGAAVVAVIFVRWRKLSFWDYADVAGPALLLAQGIGRWGNFINQELYGPPTTRPWGILIDPQNRIPPYNNLLEYPVETRFHPTFLYESITLLLGFFLLVYLNNRFRETWRSGTLFGLFLMWWGGNRAWIEFFRPDQPNIGNSALTYSMLLAGALFVAGLLILLIRYDKINMGGGSGQKRIAKPKRTRPTKTVNES